MTMFGYPSRCQQNGNSYPCTLSLACWLSGGSSQTGCGGNPWLVACCVKLKHAGNMLLKNDIDMFFNQDVSEDLE